MPPADKILLIDDDDSSRLMLEEMLSSTGHAVTGVADGAAAVRLMEREPFSLVISDLLMPGMSGIEILQHVRRITPETEVIVITGHASAETAVQAMKEGACDYITKPVNFDELRIVIAKALEKRHLLSENSYLRKKLEGRFEFSDIIGDSPAMRSLFQSMSRIARTDATVMITGESGTGKELVARALHGSGARKNKPFIAVNCSAIPEFLLESELFGHVRGAFTGAIRDKAGKFEAATGGTIFLDEIGTMPQHLQGKLLRVLQEQEMERVGSNKSIKLDARVISATNLDLEQQVKLGNFREDLYYRLNVIPLHLPPLRERRDDIMALVEHFVERCCKTADRPAMSIRRGAVDALEAYPWPGNVRELENMVERIVALTDGEVIGLEDIPAVIREKGAGPGTLHLDLPDTGIDMVTAIADLERSLISRALARTGGVKARAAALLGLNRTTLVEKMKRMGMEL